jgi:KDO2-lipid IV(A) lauroyltransferase
LGRNETYATTWVNFAALTGAAVVPAFCRARERGLYHVSFHEPFHVPSDAIAPGQAAPWVQKALHTLEEQIRLRPDQGREYFSWEPPSVERVA